MSRILITGATGFVGKSLVPALIGEGHEVLCAVSQKVEWLDTEQVLVNRLESDPDWSVALSGVDVVIHLAAKVHVMKVNVLCDDEYRSINTIATKNLAEQAAKHKVKRFVYLSSIKVNGEFTLSGAPFTEEVENLPDDPYGRSKFDAEQYLQAISQDTEMQVVIIRPPLVYGPGVRANFLKMMGLVKKGWPLPFSRVKNRRHLIYIENLISALCLVVNHPAAANQTYLVADGDSFSLAQMIRIMGNEMNVTVRLIPVPVCLMACFFSLAGMKTLNTRLFSSLELNTHKIKSQLGWVPSVGFSEGLRETVKWYQRESKS